MLNRKRRCLIKKKDPHLHEYTVWYRSKPKHLRILRGNCLCPGRHKLRQGNSGAEDRPWLPQATKTAWRCDVWERLKRRKRHEGPDWWQPNVKLLGRTPHSEALRQMACWPLKECCTPRGHLICEWRLFDLHEVNVCQYLSRRKTTTSREKNAADLTLMIELQQP